MYLNFIRYPFIFYCYEQGLIFSVQLRYMSVGNFKHFKLKVVDNVGVITIDSPGVKVSFFTIQYILQIIIHKKLTPQS